MRNYRIINDYKVIGSRISPYRIKGSRSNLFYLIWADDASAICFDRNPASLKGIGYMRLLGEAYVFEEDDPIPYIYS